MGQLDKLETTLDDSLNKKAPKLPEETRKSLAGMLWVLALIGGVAQLYMAWRLWDWGHYADQALDAYNSIAAAYGVETSGTDLGLMFYLGLVTLAVSGALLLLAAPGLKAMKKAGWNLVFYSLLVNVLYGVISLFIDTYGGFGNLFGSLVGSLIGAYLLFQVRGHFMKSPAHHTAN